MSLVDKIKSDVKKSGSNKGKILFVREGTKVRIRFLNDMEDGLEIPFHDNYTKGITPVPCQEVFGRNCPYCDEDADVLTRSQYVWSVYDYESKEVKLFMYPVNNCSPIPAIMSMYENYGTLTDRDYVISVTGARQNKTFSVVPMDKVKFRNAKAKPYSKSAVLKIVDKAYPLDVDTDDDEDEEDDRPVKSRSPKSIAKSKSTVVEDDDENEKPKRRIAKNYTGWGEESEEDDWDEEEGGEETPDYEEMSPKELFKLCKERGIDVQPKKPQKYYIKQLEEYDQAQDDWGDEDEEDEWEDDDE